jgi:hypothetical protein
MAKKHISRSDLAWVFGERMKESGVCGSALPVAIVRDGRSWVAVTDKTLLKRFPKCAKEIERIQGDLRQVYQLRR